MSEWDAGTAEWYARNYGDYATNRLAVDALDLAPDATIVDVGCGTGSALRHAAGRVTEGHLIGVDPVPRMIEIAREQSATHAAASRIEFRAGTAETLPVEDGVADVVLAFDSFDHWQNKQVGMSEVERILHPAGRVAIVKDGSVPGAVDARLSLEPILHRAGLVIEREELIEAEGVKFTLWLCRRD